MRVALYARVSSDKQDIDLSISAQLRMLREYACKGDHEIVGEFVDEAETGRTANRPVFLQMVSLARQKPTPFEAILVWKFSRFARNREDSILYKALLRRHGVKVVSINEPLDNSPTGRLMEGVIESMDEFYSANLAQDVTRGMREAVSRGFWVASHAPYGYVKVKVKDGAKERATLQVDSDTAWVIRKIFDMAVTGLGVKEIAKRLNQEGIPSARKKGWGKGQVYNVLTNEAYTGVLVWGVGGKFHREYELPPVRKENAFPALVALDIFQRVRAMLKARAPKVMPPREAGSPHLLSGLLRCGGCGAKMFGHRTVRRDRPYIYYVCAKAYRQGRDACNMGSIPAKVIEGAVVRNITAMVLNHRNIEELVKLVNEELTTSSQEIRHRLTLLGRERSQIESRLERLYDVLETGKMELEDLAPRIRELRVKKDELLRTETEARLALDKGIVEQIDAKQVMVYVKDLGRILEVGTAEERKEFLKSFVKRIFWRDPEVTVEYTLPVPPLELNLRPEEEVVHIVNVGGVLWTLLELSAARPRAQGWGNSWLSVSLVGV